MIAAPLDSVRRASAGLAALVAGGLITLGIFALLLLLNAASRTSTPPADNTRLAVLVETPRSMTASENAPDPGGAAETNEPLIVDLDAAAVIPPLELDATITPLETELDLTPPPPVPLSLSVAAAPIKVAEAPKPAKKITEQQMLEELGLATRTPPRRAVTGNTSGGGGSGRGAGVGSGSGILDAEGVDKPPRDIRRPQPAYPMFARRAGLEGSVTVKILIDTAGRVTDVQVLDVQGHPSFRDAVLDVVKQWQFEPASHRGKVVSVWGTAKIGFKLEK